CSCGGALGETVFLLTCDSCHLWFHGPCVGLPRQEDVPSTWFCAECTMV
ncbi:unnamed protein product, partial [Phaeothamnion confervicola]